MPWRLGHAISGHLDEHGACIVNDTSHKRYWQYALWTACMLILLCACARQTPAPPVTRAKDMGLAAPTETQEAVPVTLTVPATSTPLPPTDTPLPTETAIPSATATAESTPWPTPEAFFDGVRVTSFNNAGFMVVIGDTKILIDLLYDNYPVRTAPDREVLERAVKAQPPFDQADLILATHNHSDHFSPELVRDYLRRSPESVFVSSREAVRQISDLGAEFDERLIPVSLDPGESSKLSINDIALDAFYITHGERSILNICFAIQVDDITLFHSGDMNVDSKAGDAVSLADLQAFGVSEMQIDIAFLPSSVFLSEEYRPLIDDGIRASYLVPMHYAFRSPPTGIEGDFSNAIVSQETAESWVMPREYAFPEPAGTAPLLDGIMEGNEWAGAYQTHLSDGSDLYLMQDDGFVYVGIAASGADSGVGSLCIAQGGQVKILHSSAALGTAVYEKDGQAWQLIQPFSWRCRGTTDHEADQNERFARARVESIRLLQQAEAYKATQTAEAKGKAARFDQQLAEYRKAPVVTRRRLYLDFVRTVLSQVPRKYVTDGDTEGPAAHMRIVVPQ